MIQKLLISIKKMFTKIERKNFSILLIEKFIKIILGVFTTLMIARSLGPNDYGIFTYINTIYSVVAYIGAVGIDMYAIQALTKKNDHYKKIGSFFLAKFIIGLLSGFATILLILIIKSGSSYLLPLALIISTRFIFQPFNIIDSYFESQNKIPLIAISRLFAYLVSSILKIIFISFLSDKLFFLFIAIATESIMTALFHSIQYQRNKYKLSKWTLNFTKSIIFLKKTFIITSSSSLYFLIANLDKIFIAKFYNEKILGIYSAGSQLSFYWFFLPVIFGQSYIASYIKDENMYSNKNLSRLKEMFIYAGFISLIITSINFFFSQEIIKILFGLKYLDASIILKIHTLSLIFIFINYFKTRLLIIHGLGKVDMKISLYSLLVNIICLSTLGIKFGVVGVAYSFLLTMIFASIALPYVVPESREIIKKYLKSMYFI